MLALIVANLIWGAASPVFKFSLANIPPFSLAFLRFFGACLLMYPFLHQNLRWSTLKDGRIWVMAILGITFNITFFFLALQRTEAINAPVIASLGPVFILFGSLAFLHEKAKPRVIFGIVLSFIGTVTIVLRPILERGIDGEIVGNILLILATLGAVGHTIIGRKVFTPQNAAEFTFWQFFLGAASFLPLVTWEFSDDPLWMANLDHRGWTGIIFGAVLSSAVAYFCYNWALAKLPAFEVGVFTYIDPIVAIVISIPLLGEKITLPFVLGSVLVFLGILIAEKRLQWHPLHLLYKKKPVN